VKRAPKQDEGVGRGLLLFLVFYLSGFVFRSVLEHFRLQQFEMPLLETGFYDVLFVPLAYMFSDRLFCLEYWEIRSNWWIGVVVCVAIQIPISYSFRTLPRPPVAVMVGSVLVAPFVEELIRAAMMRPLIARYGDVWAIALTGFLWACIHEHFWIALVQQCALSAVFIYSRKSLPSAIAAHVVMNLAAVTLW